MVPVKNGIRLKLSVENFLEPAAGRSGQRKNLRELPNDAGLKLHKKQQVNFKPTTGAEGPQAVREDRFQVNTRFLSEPFL